MQKHTLKSHNLSQVAGKALLSFSIAAWAGVAIGVPLIKSISCNLAKTGIFFPFKSAKKRQKEKVEEDDMIRRNRNGDRISELPNAVLCSILSHLSLEEAVRTSILSRRWRHLYALMPALSFPCFRMLGGDPFPGALDDRHWDKYSKMVDHILWLYSGSKMASFKMCLCFVTEHILDAQQWLRAVARMNIRYLDLHFGRCGSIIDRDARGNVKVVNTCGFSLQLVSQVATSMEHLYLSGCSLVTTPEWQFNSLKALCLDLVVLGSGDFERILSSCVNLEKFELVNCQAPHSLGIYSSRQLKFVSIRFCPGVREIDVRCSNLVTFTIASSYVVNLYLSHIPKLEALDIYFRAKTAVPYVFSEVAKDLPNLNSLSLRASTDKLEYIEAEKNTLKNLRQLDLVLLHQLEFNLLNVAPILEACPHLVIFNMGCCDLGRYRRSLKFVNTSNRIMESPAEGGDNRGEKSPTICHHKHLKEVKFGGFVGTPNEVQVALFFLRSAQATLRRMFISSTFKYYSGNGKYDYYMMKPFSEAVREMFERELNGKACSSTAEVVIWDGCWSVL